MKKSVFRSCACCLFSLCVLSADFSFVRSLFGSHRRRLNLDLAHTNFRLSLQILHWGVSFVSFVPLGLLAMQGNFGFFLSRFCFGGRRPSSAPIDFLVQFLFYEAHPASVDTRSRSQCLLSFSLPMISPFRCRCVS
jgi:hypothetical protein